MLIEARISFGFGSLLRKYAEGRAVFIQKNIFRKLLINEGKPVIIATTCFCVIKKMFL